MMATIEIRYNLKPTSIVQVRRIPCLEMFALMVFCHERKMDAITGSNECDGSNSSEQAAAAVIFGQFQFAWQASR